MRAADILRALGFRDRSAAVARLHGLPPAIGERVQAAIAALPSGASVDLDKLIDEARRQAEQRQPKGEPWKYAITLMDQHQRAEFKRLVESGTAPNEAARRVMENSIVARLDGIASRLRETVRAGAISAVVQPDDVELDDELNDEPKRRTRCMEAKSKPEKPAPEPYCNNRGFGVSTFGGDAPLIEDLSFRGPL